MKINSVRANNRKKCFEIEVGKQRYVFPYSKLEFPPGRIVKAYVDKELGREAFAYITEVGEEQSVHVEQVLDFNDDPGYCTELLIYRLTILLQSKLKEKALSKRQLARLLHTSPAQLDRLLDQTNYAKSIRQLLTALHILDCQIDFVEVHSKKQAA